MPFVTTQRTEDETDREVEQLELAIKKRKRLEPDAAGSKHYTQTLTQIDFVSPIPFVASPHDFDKENYSPAPSKLRKKVYGKAYNRPESPRIGMEHRVRQVTKRHEPPPTPETPRKQIAREIPSSQSPATPLSFRGSPSYRETDVDTPTRFRHNSSSPLRLPTLPREPLRNLDPPRLVIEDTYESSSSELHTQATNTPLSIYSDPKIDGLPLTATQSTTSNRISSTNPTTSGSDCYPNIEKDSISSGTQLRSSIKTVRFTDQLSTAHTTSTVPLDLEIGDSDANSDDDLDLEFEIIGDDTQAAFERATSSAELEIVENDMKGTTSRGTIDRGQESSASVLKSDSCIVYQREGRSQNNTQFDSQRLSTQHIQNMATRTDSSDVFVSLPPDEVQAILSRLQCHVSRDCAFPASVVRLWVYETTPKSTLQYVFSIGTAKSPHDLQNAHGIGNQVVNSVDIADKYAYEIWQAYELADPMSLEALQSNHWLEVPPSRFSWVRPAVLDRLMANLMYPLFEEEVIVSSSEPQSDSQDAEAQLYSTMLQFSEPAGPSEDAPEAEQLREAENDELDVPTQIISQRDHCLGGHKGTIDELPRPSQATTVDMTQSPSRSQFTRGTSPILGEETTLIPESPAKSCMPALPTSQQQWQNAPLPFPLSSSSDQVVHMLPDSLLNEGSSLAVPPTFVEDSEAESDLDG